MVKMHGSLPSIFTILFIYEHYCNSYSGLK